jgi:hypothetical protein
LEWQVVIINKSIVSQEVKDGSIDCCIRIEIWRICGRSDRLGLSVIGAGIGIGIIGGKTVEATARQPEMKNELRTLMFLGAAL